MHTFKANQWGFTFYSSIGEKKETLHYLSCQQWLNPKQDAETGVQDLHEKRNRLQLAQNKFYLG